VLDSQNLWAVYDMVPLLALDVYEHAYVPDFDATLDGRARYVEAFFDNLGRDTSSVRSGRRWPAGTAASWWRRGSRRSGWGGRASRPGRPCGYAGSTGGRRSAHGRARSSCAESLSSIGSWPGAPTICTAHGMPSPANPAGIDAAGLPHRFHTAV
jgi:hypothetical protein